MPKAVVKLKRERANPWRSVRQPLPSSAALNELMVSIQQMSLIAVGFQAGSSSLAGALSDLRRDLDAAIVLNSRLTQ